MDFKVEWAESAFVSLSEALDYIAKDSPSYAASLAVQAERAVFSLRQLPHRGRVVREYRDPNVREIPVSSYRLIYPCHLAGRHHRFRSLSARSRSAT